MGAPAQTHLRNAPSHRVLVLALLALVALVAGCQQRTPTPSPTPTVTPTATTPAPGPGGTVTPLPGGVTPAPTTPALVTPIDGGERTPPPEGTGVVQGMVLNNGQPAAGVRLDLWHRTEPRNRILASTTSTEQGRYIFYEVPRGQTYFVQFYNGWDGVETPDLVGFWNSVGMPLDGTQAVIPTFDMGYPGSETMAPRDVTLPIPTRGEPLEMSAPAYPGAEEYVFRLVQYENLSPEGWYVPGQSVTRVVREVRSGDRPDMFQVSGDRVVFRYDGSTDSGLLLVPGEYHWGFHFRNRSGTGGAFQPIRFHAP